MSIIITRKKGLEKNPFDHIEKTCDACNTPITVSISTIESIPKDDEKTEFLCSDCAYKVMDEMNKKNIKIKMAPLTDLQVNEIVGYINKG